MAEPTNPIAYLSHDVTNIPAEGLNADWSATLQELAGFAEVLQVLSFEEVAFRYEIKRHGKNRPSGARYRVSGILQARLTQTSVVSLEPIVQRIHESIDEEFHPASDITDSSATSADAESEILSQSDPEPIVDGKLEIGRLVFESLSSAIDPFPRKEGERLEWQDKQDADEIAAENPFAVLAKLKDDN